MTTVVSNPFNVSVVAAGEYAALPVGGSLELWWGSYWNYGAPTNEPHPSMIAYSTQAVDTNRNKLICGGGGGGHGDYRYNDIWEFDLSSKTWAQITPRSPGYTVDQLAEALANADNFNHPGAYISPLSPISRHTTTGVEFVASVNKWFVAGGSTWSGGYGSGDHLWRVWPNSPGDFWSWTPTAGVNGWAFHSSGLLTPDTVPFSGMLVQSRVRGKAYMLTDRKYINYNPSAFAVDRFPFSEMPATQVMGWALFELDPSTVTWTRLTMTNMPNLSWPLLTLDEQHDRLVLMNNTSPRRVFVCPLATKVWQEVACTGTAPPIRDNEGDRTLFSTLTNRTLYVCGDEQCIYALTISAQGTTGVWERVNPVGSYRFGLTSNGGARQAQQACWDDRNKLVIYPRQDNSSISHLAVFCTKA